MAIAIQEDQHVTWRTNAVPGSLECTAFGGTVSVGYRESTVSGVSTFSVDRSAVIDFEPSESMTITDLTRRVTSPIQYLLTFLCGVPVQLLSLQAELNSLGMQVGSRWQPRTIDVGYRGWPQPAGRDGPVVMRLTLPMIEKRFGEILSRWQSLYERHERAMQLLFSISLGLQLYLDTRFLFAIQALELYHRARSPRRASQDHKVRVRGIIDSVANQDDKRWLKEKLSYSHEPTLKERLEQLVEYAGPESSHFLRSDFVPRRC